MLKIKNKNPNLHYQNGYKKYINKVMKEKTQRTITKKTWKLCDLRSKSPN